MQVAIIDGVPHYRNTLGDRWEVIPKEVIVEALKSYFQSKGE